MAWQVMPTYSSYSTAREEFTWDIPEKFNPARDFLRNHEDPSPDQRNALIDAVTDETYTFRDIDELSGILATALIESGVDKGDRIGIIAPQRIETALTHLAAWRIGAVSIPMTTMYGPDAIRYRIKDANADVVIFDPIVRDAVKLVLESYSDLDFAIQLSNREWYVGQSENSDELQPVGTTVYSYDEFTSGYTPREEIIDSTPDTDSTIMYTSGSTGQPKGVLHGHGLWLGRAAAAYNFFDRKPGYGEVMWTPADWAWASALGGLLMGSWHHGATVVAAPMQGFEPEPVFELCQQYEITNALIPPTALRILMDADVGQYDLELQTIASAGEPLTPEILDWAESNFEDLSVNEYYGQTELNLVVANSSDWFKIQPGSMGKPLPGYEVAILDPETREEVPTGEIGEIAVKPDDDRVFFNRYINRPDATESKTYNEWYLTGDHASIDEDGYVWFESRADDVIITSGYRVGPLEVEEVLLKHPGVEQVGVVGVPHDQRGEIIKAYVEPALEPSDEIKSELQDLARERLAKHEYPREIEFVDSLPMTSSGKIQRAKLRNDK